MKGKQLLVIGLTMIFIFTMLPGLALAQEPAGSPLMAAFTYQGRLNSNGVPYTGDCDFEFGLWDALSSGTQLGTTQTVTNVVLVDGDFTVQLDYGGDKFQGEARWLEIYVRCPAGSGTYTQLTPRQALTASPYALFALSANPSVMQRRVNGNCGNGFAISAIYENGTVTCQNVDKNAWLMTGNSGTTPGVNYVGTNDNQALVFKVNGQRALRLEPNEVSPNIIGGFIANWAVDGVLGATISGGGDSSHANMVTDDYGTVGGGAGNQAGDNASNTYSAYYATVSGGRGNIAGVQYATIGGGYGNQAGESGMYGTVGGGKSNTAAGAYTTVAGGKDNGAGGTLGGYSSVGGGYSNAAEGECSTIGGGEDNYTEGFGATVSGGSNSWATGAYATVPGGDSNQASGEYSFAAGYAAVASYDGSFIWADSTGLGMTDAWANSFNIRAGGGARITADNINYGLAVYNEGADTTGPAIRAYGNESEGDSTGAVFAWNDGDSPAIYAKGSGTYAGYFAGQIYTSACVGCLLIQFGQNDGAGVLQPGDLAAISGLGKPLDGSDQPILSVHRAAAGETVVGIVQVRGVRTESTEDNRTLESIDLSEGDVQPGDYLFLVVYGPAQVKADASLGAIAVGTRLASSMDPGYARALRTITIEGVQVAEATSSVGIALEPLDSGTGLISVFVTLH